ncbi:1-deoxy-D-xylulose-5-phosphate synthase [Thermodesulfobium narugense DSM 14796]|uniref:1-deoxy-D-xylulose-5-phosphate synthase n=1 Tax=Thermodesulfobium narugense DSM 14796 TaxID=747365 RepID=M1E8R0_9BACT|nr:1-deoxy-D-xylulose-5-phosphate synthase [Thermodesulfobium narugense]AEE14624.1 1-deoxy-D-xylulose-5-phosphate synthase [Thermodesulfobium narugense DSM 14796]
MEILNNLKDPKDVSKLSIDEKLKLAKEIRKTIIKTVSKNGGHLSSNLGVVELTIALLSKLDLSKDFVIFDVGHQIYPYKLLTNRFDKFATLRQYNGISGFPKREESPYDFFGTGHAGTSISAALGACIGKELLNKEGKVVAIIGDGAMTCGMALEAFNYLGHTKSDLTVILNHNEMSISPNVGALARTLLELRTHPFYKNFKSTIETLSNRLPNGKTFLDFALRFRDAFKEVLIGKCFFEELGINYYGPIDGHNLKLLEYTIERTLNHPGPKVLHVVTKKGYGYKMSEENPTFYHSAPKFEISTGKPIHKDISFTKIFSEEIVEIARNDKNVVAITAAMPDGTGLTKFAKEFPDRFFDVGIAEQHAVTFAAGLSTQGLKPVVAIYSTFLQRAYDQVIHDVALQNLPVIFVLDRSGLCGPDGPTHHGAFDVSFLMPIPNLHIFVPSDEIDLKNMLRHSINLNKPVIIRYPKGKILSKRSNASTDFDEPELLNKGSKIAILSIGPISWRCLDMLEKNNLTKEVSIFAFKKIKPWSEKTEKIFREILETHQKIITVEENSTIGGFGSYCLFIASKFGLADKFLDILGFPDYFMPHGDNESILKQIGLDEESILKSINNFLNLQITSKKLENIAKKS